MKRLLSFNNEVYLDKNIIHKTNAKEAKIYPFLKKNKVPTVRIKSIKGANIQLYYYPSKTIKENPSKKAYEKVGKIYRKMHRVEGKSNKEFVESIEIHFDKLPKSMKEKLRKYLKNIDQKKLIHADPASTNILVGKYIKLIDFEFTRFGDPLYDIALFECKHPTEYHKYFHKGYEKTFDNNNIRFYKILHEQNMLSWAKKNKRTTFAKQKRELRNKYFKELITLF